MKTAPQEQNEKSFGLNFIAETAIHFASSGINHEIYHFIGQSFLKLNPGAIIVVNSIDLEQGFLRTEEFIMPGTLFGKIVTLLGFNPKGKVYKIDESIFELSTGVIRKFQHGIYELTFKNIPESVGKSIEKVFNLGDIYGIAFIVDGRIFGNSVIILPRGKELAHPEIIETFVRQASVTLKRIAAEKNEEKYRSLFEFMSDGAFYQHADGQLIDVNNAALNLLGVTRDVFLSTDPKKTEWKIIDEYLQPISPDGFPSRMALSTGKPVKNRILAVFNSEKQSYNWALINAIPQFLPGESTPYRVFVTMHDITEQKRFENKIRESEVNARAIMEATDDVLILLDTEGVVVDCNEAHAKRLGLTRLDLLGKNVFDYHPADVGTRRREILREVIVSGEPGHFVDFRAGFWNEVSIYPIFNDQRIATKVAIFSRDITAKKVVENALVESEARLRETNAAKDKFFSIIAHDLKSPFNSILGFSDLLQSEARDSDIETIVQYAGIIYSSANNTLKLLDNLLIWARLQQGKISFEPKMLLLNEIIQAEIRGLLNSAAQKNIELSGEIMEHIIITADQNMLSAILRNLITNSIKFTPKNGKVHVNATCEGSQVVVAVSDTGVGMTGEAIGNLFRSETFESTRGTENEKGTGLGLLLCKEFVEKHEGKIWVESQPGNGSVFRFSVSCVAPSTGLPGKNCDPQNRNK